MGVYKYFTLNPRTLEMVLHTFPAVSFTTGAAPGVSATMAALTIWDASTAFPLLPLLYLQPVCEELSAKNSVPCTKISCSLTLSTIDRAVCKEQRLLSQDLHIPQFVYSWSDWSVVELVCPGYSCSHLCHGYPGCSKSAHRTCWRI